MFVRVPQMDLKHIYYVFRFYSILEHVIKNRCRCVCLRVSYVPLFNFAGVYFTQGGTVIFGDGRTNTYGKRSCSESLFGQESLV